MVEEVPHVNVRRERFRPLFRALFEKVAGKRFATEAKKMRVERAQLKAFLKDGEVEAWEGLDWANVVRWVASHGYDIPDECFPASLDIKRFDAEYLAESVKLIALTRALSIQFLMKDMRVGKKAAVKLLNFKPGVCFDVEVLEKAQAWVEKNLIRFEPRIEELRKEGRLSDEVVKKGRVKQWRMCDELAG